MRVNTHMPPKVMTTNNIRVVTKVMIIGALTIISQYRITIIRILNHIIIFQTGKKVRLVLILLEFQRFVRRNKSKINNWLRHALRVN